MQQDSHILIDIAKLLQYIHKVGSSQKALCCQSVGEPVSLTVSNGPLLDGCSLSLSLEPPLPHPHLFARPALSWSSARLKICSAKLRTITLPSSSAGIFSSVPATSKSFMTPTRNVVASSRVSGSRSRSTRPCDTAYLCALGALCGGNEHQRQSERDSSCCCEAGEGEREQGGRTCGSRMQ